MTGLACLLLAEGTLDAARYVAAVAGTAFTGLPCLLLALATFAAPNCPATVTAIAFTGLPCLLLAQGYQCLLQVMLPLSLALPSWGWPACCLLRGPCAAAGYVATVTGTAFMGLACLLLATLRWRIGPAYVDDAEVAAQVAAVAPISAVYQIPDGIYCLASGVLR